MKSNGMIKKVAKITVEALEDVAYSSVLSAACQLKNAPFKPPSTTEATEDETIIRIDLPGVEKENISIFSEGRIVSISANRKNEKAEHKNGCQSREKYFGKMSRDFILDSDIDCDEIKAKLENGVLIIICKHTKHKETKKVIVE